MHFLGGPKKVKCVCVCVCVCVCARAHIIALNRHIEYYTLNDTLPLQIFVHKKILFVTPQSYWTSKWLKA